MSQKADTLKAPIPKEKGQSTLRWRISILAICLTALVLVALAVLMVTPAGKPVMLPRDGDSRFVTNPELLVVQRYAQAAAMGAQTAFLASNPELLVVRHYAGSGVQEVEASFLSANPELMVARRYSRSLEENVANVSGESGP
jgi:hypothetical protein